MTLNKEKHRNRAFLVTLASELGNDVVHVLELAHGTNVSTKLLLGKLLSTLLLRVTDKLNQTALVRSKTGNLVNKGSDELSLLRNLSFAGSKSGLNVFRSDLVAVVVTNSDTGFRGRCHYYAN